MEKADKILAFSTDVNIVTSFYGTTLLKRLVGPQVERVHQDVPGWSGSFMRRHLFFPTGGRDRKPRGHK